MIGVPLADRAAGAVRNALLSHGWEGVSSSITAASLEPWAHHFTGLTADQVEGLLRTAPRFGLDLITGEDWALLSGTRSRLSAFARSWQLPPELAELVIALGTGLPADPAPHWRVGEEVIDLSRPVILERLPAGAVEIVAARVADGVEIPERGGGALLVAADPALALPELEAALDRLLVNGFDVERIALEPGWMPGAPALGVHRRFGRPLVCTTNDPVAAVLARQQGAQIFRTTRPDGIRLALEMLEQASR